MSTDKQETVKNFTENPERVNPWKRFFKVLFARKLVVFGVFIIVVFIFTAIFAPCLAPCDPYKQDLRSTTLQSSLEHPLGTDALGRDIFSRIIYGSRTAIMVGVVALGIASIIGMTMGLVAGYFGGVTNTIIMRITDSLMSFPLILMALIVAAVLGGGLMNVMIALGVGLIPGYCRLMCGQVLTVRENDYILASKSLGAGNIRIMLAHVLPNCFPPLIVMMTLMMGMTILAEAGLSFLGIGIEPPGAAWGAMVSDGYKYILSHPVLSVAPGCAIMLVVFAFNIVGDGLRDALDPRLRGTL